MWVMFIAAKISETDMKQDTDRGQHELIVSVDGLVTSLAIGSGGRQAAVSYGGVVGLGDIKDLREKRCSLRTMQL